MFRALFPLKLMVRLVLALLALYAVSSASESYYVSGGVGTIGGRLAFGASATNLIQPFTMSARAMFSTSTDKPSTWETDFTREFALLAGWRPSSPGGRPSFTLEAGVGAVSITETRYVPFYTDFGTLLSAQKRKVSEVGLAMQSQIYVSRVGIIASANFNKRDNLFGILACFRLGRIR